MFSVVYNLIQKAKVTLSDTKVTHYTNNQDRTSVLFTYLHFVYLLRENKPFFIENLLQDGAPICTM
jgi:hypothetical protein